MSESNRLYLADLGTGHSQIRLGPFRLYECVGEGSMGEVWRGYHIEQDVEVALKVILSEHAKKKRHHQAFRQEARSIAELHHPFVVDVVDYGAVDDAGERSTMGRFSQGSPYLVMDYAAYGSLADHLQGPMSWPVVRMILFTLLDALAHSHARGVLHRDVKPQNVLVSETGSGPGIQLTDFGLAYALRTSQEVAEWHRAAGTPEYMSPEQLNARWRRYGPSTDLYGLGCLAWEMLTGAPPYCGDNAIQLAHAHLQKPLPQLSGDIDAPAAVEPWLHTMLGKDPADRFRSAADAAWALRQFTDPFDDDSVSVQWQQFLDSASSSKNSKEQSVTPIRPTHTLEVIVEGASSSSSGNEHDWPQTPHIDRPIPSNWKHRRLTMAPVRMIGTGSGLFGLRRLPVIGRDDERDKLWSQLRTCSQHQKLGVTFVSGPAGIGKDCLARWLCDRAEELGVAQVFRVPHEATDEFVNTLGRMLRRKFSLDGLTRCEINSFFQTLLQKLDAEDRYEWEAITEVVSPATDNETQPSIQFNFPRQRYLAVAHFLQRLSKRGPIVLWFKNIQWARDALKFVQFLLEQQQIEAPIHIVMTGRHDLSDTQAPSRQTLQTIAASKTTETIELQALDETKIRRLVEESMFLDPSAAYEVVHRSGGNPLYALETVRSWIDRDLLIPDRQGYRLRDDANPAPSGKWIDVWSDIVDRLVDGDNDNRTALEIAALLGDRFQRLTWDRAAQLAGTNVCQRLVETLFERRYLSEDDQTLRFSQSLFREALIVSARRGGRRRQLCEICVEAIDETADSPAAVDERSAFLLCEAGQHLAAGRRFLRAARRRQKDRDYHAMIYLSQRGLEAIEQLPSQSQLKVEVSLLDILSHGWHGIQDNERALKTARRGRRLAEQLGPPFTGLLDHRLMAPLNIAGKVDEATEVASSALKALEGYDEFCWRRSQVYLLLANVERRRGHWNKAMSLTEKARDTITDPDQHFALAQIESTQLKIRVTRGDDVDPVDIEKHYQRCRQHRITIGEATLANLRAEYARRTGEPEVARTWYKRALRISELFDPDRAVSPQLNLALIHMGTGDIATAGHRAERVLQALRRNARPQMELYCQALMLPSLAADGDIERFRKYVDEVEAKIDRFEVRADYDLTLCIETTIEQLTEAKNDDHPPLRKRLEEILAVVRSD